MNFWDERKGEWIRNHSDVTFIFTQVLKTDIAITDNYAIGIWVLLYAVKYPLKLRATAQEHKSKKFETRAF